MTMRITLAVKPSGVLRPSNLDDALLAKGEQCSRWRSGIVTRRGGVAKPIMLRTYKESHSYGWGWAGGTKKDSGSDRQGWVRGS